MTKLGLLAASGVMAVTAAAVVTVLILRGAPSPSDHVEGDGHDHGPGGPLVVQLLKSPETIDPFTVTDLDGRTMSSADWRGKVVLVNFWATWCPPCLAEIPDLIALQEKYPDQLLVVGVSEDEAGIPFVKEFAAERKINYPIVMATAELRERFPNIIALPTTFVLDGEGRLAKKHVGILRPDETEAVARALAGLPVDAIVERVDDPGRLSLESAAQVKDIPGIDLSRVPPDRKVPLIQALNSEKCTCGCDLTVAKCRIDDPTCTVSLPVAQKIADRFASASQP